MNLFTSYWPQFILLMFIGMRLLGSVLSHGMEVRHSVWAVLGRLSVLVILLGAGGYFSQGKVCLL